MEMCKVKRLSLIFYKEKRWLLVPAAQETVIPLNEIASLALQAEELMLCCSSNSCDVCIMFRKPALNF